MKIKIESLVRVLIGVYCFCTGLHIVQKKADDSPKAPIFGIPDRTDLNYEALMAMVQSANDPRSSSSIKESAFDKMLKMGLESKDNKFKAKCIEGLMFIANQSTSSNYLKQKAADYTEQIKDSAINEKDKESD